ncbi:hypothetical protein D3C85_1248960 [compost metagenome]
MLRWRLAPGSWELVRTLESVHLINRHDGVFTLDVQASMALVRCELVEGWESRHYLEKTPVPVLEIEVQQPGTLTTDVRWAV